MRRLRIVLALGLGLGLAPALAQVPVQTLPGAATTAGGNASGTVGTGGTTFQLVFAGAGNSIAPATSTPGARHGCSIQNNGTHVMYVTEALGVSASTQAKAWQVSAYGGIFNCNFAGVVFIGEIDLTGTAGDAFAATQF